MKILTHMTDGGKDSVVHGYWLIEWKALFSIVLLVFESGSREAFHSHAFNCVSWVLRGKLVEDHLSAHKASKCHLPSYRPFITRREDFHRVTSIGKTYVLSFRGAWNKTWKEYLPELDELHILNPGRWIREKIKSPKLNINPRWKPNIKNT